MRFIIFIRIPQRMATKSDNIGNTVATPVARVMGNYRNENNNSLLSFPANSPTNSMLMAFRKYEYSTPGTIGLNSMQRNSASMVPTSSNFISLPIPTNLQDQNEARLGRFDSRYIADLAAQAFQANDFSKLAQADGGVLYDMMSQGKNPTDEAAYLARFLGSDIGRAFSAGRGVAANPKAALVYEGHEFKIHSFMWNLTPKSEADSFALRQIVEVVKRNKLPTLGGLVAERSFLRYPAIVDLYLMGVDENFFYKFKPAMLRSFNINYSGQNAVSILRGSTGGRPTNVTIEMNFIETDIHYSHEYGGEMDIGGAGNSSENDSTGFGRR